MVKEALTLLWLFQPVFRTLVYRHFLGIQEITLVKKEKADTCFHFSRRAMAKFASAFTIQVRESYASFQQSR